jgi:transmembrane sensor
MNPKEQQVRAAIAEQAAEWLVAHKEGLNAHQAAELSDWLRASPAHVEAFLRASAVARDLREARDLPQYSVEALLAQAREESGASVSTAWPGLARRPAPTPRRWLAAASALAAAIVLGIGVSALWTTHFYSRPPLPVSGIPTLHFETGHGQMLTQRLADNSVLHLNTDSAVTVRFSATERLVMVNTGQVAFEVSHDPRRAFRVLGGAAEVIAIGTQFDVRVREDSTQVTVMEGRVSVGLARAPDGPGAARDVASRYVQVSADQSLRVAPADWPAAPVRVDAQRAVAWLHREIVFDHEPLDSVVAEFNRYAPKPVVIVTPSLRQLQISGSFATDDTEAFIAFLKTLKGLRVQVTATEIQVSRQ